MKEPYSKPDTIHKHQRMTLLDKFNPILQSTVPPLTQSHNIYWAHQFQVLGPPPSHLIFRPTTLPFQPPSPNADQIPQRQIPNTYSRSSLNFFQPP